MKRNRLKKEYRTLQVKQKKETPFELVTAEGEHMHFTNAQTLGKMWGSITTRRARKRKRA